MAGDTVQRVRTRGEEGEGQSQGQGQSQSQRQGRQRQGQSQTRRGRQRQDRQGQNQNQNHVSFKDQRADQIQTRTQTQVRNPNLDLDPGPGSGSGYGYGPGPGLLPSVPTHGPIHTTIYTDTPSHVPTPTPTPSHVPIPTHTPSHVPIPTPSHVPTPTLGPIHTTISISTLPTVQHPAYCAKPGRKDDSSHKDASVVHSVESLKALGFEVVEWDGITPRPLLDSKGRIIGALAGRPTNPNYQTACTQMYTHLTHIGSTPAIQDHYTKLPPSRRGNFPAYNVGLSYGKGQKKPQRLKNPPRIAPLLDGLLEDRGVKNVASFQSAAFVAWAPKLAAHYKTYLDKIYSHPKLASSSSPSQSQSESQSTQSPSQSNPNPNPNPNLSLPSPPHNRSPNLSPSLPIPTPTPPPPQTQLPTLHLPLLRLQFRRQRLDIQTPRLSQRSLRNVCHHRSREF
ncbi:hypothetical protein D9758_004460 [Tetrapyrgos nigripes]|uniref:Uncharacterized protein n=1 Tax=Tetrapyrgos nigripes TaxID=182062 RepID=A0A8H5GMX0_9AGAR|nr:hypothetical protein D9758_004460 [Tetrapyrgos nigripes]